MEKAKIQYTDEGVEVIKPVAPIVPEKKPWEPKVGHDTRDLRDPQKIGRRILARVRRKTKGKK